MKRRKFLKSSVAGGTVAISGISLLAACSRGAMPPDGLESLFPDNAQIMQFGREYRANHPDEDDLAMLKDLTATVEDSSLSSAVIKEDFARGDVVKIDGWILSRTEARLCAIYSILAS